ncbi:MAG TPA: CsgE family curli-type amyloid fiber assembly protein [Lentimicrobium sp.]|nr:CsgE family curli-type amyloid fiber assembly protein [Lentimicrobium sp.]
MVLTLAFSFVNADSQGIIRQNRTSKKKQVALTGSQKNHANSRNVKKVNSKNTYNVSVSGKSDQDTVSTHEEHALVDTSLNKAIAEDKGTVEELVMEIQGLIIDQTRTKAGHDFYELLYNAWEDPPEVENYVIKIEEKPYRVNVTMLEVWVDDEILGSTILQPRQDLIEELVVSVNQALKEYLINRKEVMKQLESEDVSGTGIF